jgi:hypothetical protein
LAQPLGAAAALAAPTPARAQMPTVDPGGASAQPAPAPPPTPAPAQPIIIPLQPGDAAAAPEVPDRWYQTEVDPDGDRTQQQWDTGMHGPVPEHHVVRRGDTLWDISWVYFNNPWVWPKVWSYNPAITNPHWIYPGDLVRLYAQGEAPAVVAPPDEGTDVDVVAPAAHYDVALRQLAFVDRDKLTFAGTITGSVEERELLSVGDHVYLSYEGEPPKVGRRYAIYTESETVKHPKSGKPVGSYVRLLGELTVVSVKKEKRARAVIEESVDIIERGARVGPLQRSFRGEDIELVPNQHDRQGVIVAMLRSDQLIGNGQIVFVDLGTNQGVKKGNLLHVVRRGDAFEKTMDPRFSVGQDNPDYPSRSIGRIAVVQAGRNVSVGLVMSAEQELGVGDFVLMLKSAP